MNNKIKQNLRRCLLTSLIALLLLGCSQSSSPEVKYTISYFSDYGLVPRTIELSPNTKLTEFDLPLLEDEKHIFNGWYCNNILIKPNDVINDNLKLTASWSPKTVVQNVEFSVADGEIEYRDVITLTCKTKNAIIHYSVNNGEENICTTGTEILIEQDSQFSAYATAYNMEKSNTTKAVYKVKTYKVEYETEYGKAPTAITGLVKDSTITAEQLPELKCNNKVFLGWFLDGFQITTDYKIVSDIKLIAKWIDVDTVQEVWISPNSSNIVAQDKITLFCGTTGATIYYSINNGAYVMYNPISKFSINNSSIIRAYAKLDGMNDSKITEKAYTVNTYTVKFETAHGIAPSDIPGLVQGSTLTYNQIAELSCDGYVFNGWYDGNVKVDTNYKITKDTYLKAKWTKKGGNLDGIIL